MELDLVAALKTQCSQTYPDIGPQDVKPPYVTWQAIGGESRYALNNTPIDKRNTLMQINVWAATRQSSIDLMRSIEVAITASSAFVATPEGEPISVHEEDTSLFGSIQRYSIWSDR